jgi:hypothetical protein
VRHFPQYPPSILDRIPKQVFSALNMDGHVVTFVLLKISACEEAPAAGSKTRRWKIHWMSKFAG